MKKLVCALTLSVMTVLSSICTYAGSWQRDHIGWWYKLSGGGYCANTWFQDSDSKWYYFNKYGYMVAEQWIGDYYLGADGAMATNQMIGGGYWVGADGKWDPYTNNLAGLTGKFYFISDRKDMVEWDGDTLHIKGYLYRQSDNENLGYTEEWLEVEDYSIFYLLSGAGIEAYLTKEGFKTTSRHLDIGETLWLEVYSGKIISAWFSN